MKKRNQKTVTKSYKRYLKLPDEKTAEYLWRRNADDLARQAEEADAFETLVDNACEWEG